MKNKWFIFTAVLLFLCKSMTIVTGCKTSTEPDNDPDTLVECETTFECDDGTIESRTAIVYAISCGYYIRIWTGDIGHLHNFNYIPDCLPDKFKVNGLWIDVTYCYTGEMSVCVSMPVIHIIEIQ